MRLRHAVPFLILFGWQAAPSTNPADRPSRVRLWFGAGASLFDYAYMGTGGGGCLEPGVTCGCTSYAPTYSRQYDEQASTHVVGVQMDAWASPRLRISTAYGSAGLSSHGESPPFLAGLIASERPRLGIGIGWAAPMARQASWSAREVGYDGLSAYLRLGPLDGVHFRADLRAPTSTPGVTGWARAGLGYNLGRRNGASAFLGIAAVEAGPDTTYSSDPMLPARVTKPAAFLDATLGLGRTLGVFVRGHSGGLTAWGFGLGLVLRLAR